MTIDIDTESLPVRRAGGGRLLCDKYQLIRPVGQGGMGVVWIAHNQVLDVAVAVKLSHQSSGPESTRSAQRALSEARLSAQLTHPAVCRVIDYGTTDDGEAFVVSELLHGQNLADALARKKRLSPVRAVQTILPILDALSAAHERGIVHRDVKPANIFLARSIGDRTQPKLLDFGIAQLMSTRHQEPHGSTLGTPCYMSPEQARGDEVDFRSDIWSVCVTLYELVSGVVPFLADDYDGTLELLKHAEPKPLVEYAAGDVRLGRIVARGLQKNPTARYQSASELALELAAWLVSHGEREDASGLALSARLNDSVPVQLLTPIFARPALTLLGPELQRPPLATTLIRQRRESEPAPAPTRSTRRISRVMLAAVGLLSLLGCGAWLMER